MTLPVSSRRQAGQRFPFWERRIIFRPDDEREREYFSPFPAAAEREMAGVRCGFSPWFEEDGLIQAIARRFTRVRQWGGSRIRRTYHEW